MSENRKRSATMKHFTILENEGDAESPMIGTINNTTDDVQGEMAFRKRLMQALCTHFDVNEELLKVGELPELFVGSPYEDIKIKVDGVEYEIRIIETWIF